MSRGPRPMIEATGLQRRYRLGESEVSALSGLDFSAARGEMVALMGPSGCGKTTLLNCLAGLDTPDAGTVRIDGTLLSSMSDRERTDYRARHMGFIFQAFNLLPVLNAQENVELPLLISGVPSAEARRRALVALERMGLADRARHAPSQLSGGQQQRVAVARALATEPTIIWADEPTGNLDSSAAGDVLDLLGSLHADGAHTIVIVTHDRSVADRADRIVHLRDGRIEAEERGNGVAARRARMGPGG